MDYWSALVLGLVGGVHCAGMCGPLALALPSAGSTPLTFGLGRLAYNLGRIVTYCVLGLVFGLAGETLLLSGVQRWVSIGLGLLLLAGLFASPKLVAWVPVSRVVEGLKRRMSVLLQQRSVWSLGLLGLCNGLLPCGLVYVACAGAMAAGGILPGIAYMAAFGLGTVPVMLTMGLTGRLMPISFRLKLRRAVPVTVFLVAALLILRGMSLGIPYVSPDLSSCCHDTPDCHK